MSIQSQQAWPLVDFARLHGFALNPQFRARVPFYHDGYWYVGAQWTAVQSDLKAWDFWRFGRWRGPAPSRAVPSSLAVSGMVLDETDPASPIAELASGENLVMTCGILYRATITEAMLEWRVYNCATGALETGSVALNSNETQLASLPTLEVGDSGSYLLWARLASIETELLTAEQYESLTGDELLLEYEYSEGGEVYFWDWRRNLGRLPSDPANPFYALRDALVRAGGQEDKAEWAPYIADAYSADGEWSCLRLQVGGGTWAVAPGVLPAPGAVLYRKPVAAALADPMEAVLFDITARSVSAATVARDGRLLVAGNRASRSGPQLALWVFGDEWELLGLSANLSNGWCECSLSSHDCGSVLEARDGQIYVLSKCSLHRYVSGADDPAERLPDYPASTGGHPGGQCLQETAGLDWLTEYFGLRTEPQHNTAQFYNTRQSLLFAGRSIVEGTGTVCHGPNAMAVHQGSLIGIVQNKPFEDETAEGRLARINGQRWDNNEPSWPANAFLLQGLESVQGKLICHGVEADSELPLMAVLDGGGEDGDGTLQFARFPFRVERMTKIVRDGREELLILGKEVDDPSADLDEIPYSLIHMPFQMGQPWIHFCLMWDSVDRFSIPISDLPDEYPASGAPLYLSYFPVDGGPGYWIPQVEEPENPYLQRVITGTHLQFVLHGIQPYNFDAYDRICYTGTEPGGEGGGGWGGPRLEPEPSDTNAEEAINHMPEGTKYTAIRVNLSHDWWAAQIDDCNLDKPLARFIRDYPCLWLCLDKTAADDDLSAYNFRVRRINENGRFDLPRTITPEADEFIRAVYLWPPLLDGEAYEVQSYAIQPRD